MATSYPGGIDAWSNPGPTTPENDAAFYHDVLHGNHNDAIEAIETELGTNPKGTAASVGARIAALEVGGANKDTLYTPNGTCVWVEEFNGAALDSNYVRVDYAGDAGHLTWTQANGVLAAQHNSTADAASGRMHGLVQPLIGGAFAAGDALVCGWTTACAYATSYAMVGFGLSDGTTHGTSNIIQLQTYVEGGVAPVKMRLNSNPGFQGDGSQAQIQMNTMSSTLFGRMVMTSANNWRFDYSYDGVGWVTGLTTAYTITPTHMGFFVSNWTIANPFAGSYKFLRRYAGVS
jgi:hypothetical protein